MTENPIWTAPELSNDDQKLIEAYKAAGRSLDDLAYTKEFDVIAKTMGASDSHGKHTVYKRLLTLRKQGMLPRISEFSVDSSLTRVSA
jgi:hypothetical protein